MSETLKLWVPVDVAEGRSYELLSVVVGVHSLEKENLVGVDVSVCELVSSLVAERCVSEFDNESDKEGVGLRLF